MQLENVRGLTPSSERPPSTGEAVLSFYKTLPFNYHHSRRRAAALIHRQDPLRAYPVLKPLFQPGLSTLDLGCGAGWLSLSLALHHRLKVTGLDFNPVALSRARELAELLELDLSFEEGDLLSWRGALPFELILSLGVLHHTEDCLGALRRVARDLLAPGGWLFVGLYHRDGRRPFLNHFAQLRAQGADEERLLEEYQQLHPLKDELHLRSWFRDQVCHPHETQHRLSEILPILEEEGLELRSCSLNHFAPIESLPELLALEGKQEERGLAALAAGRYFPGFFLFLAQKRGA